MANVHLQYINGSNIKTKMLLSFSVIVPHDYLCFLRHELYLGESPGRRQIISGKA